LLDYEIVRELRFLRGESLVRLERGRWNATSPFATSPSVPLSEFKVPAEPEIPGLPYTTKWSPGKSPILNIVPQQEVPPADKARPDPDQMVFPGPWGMFQKLLSYYTDCVRNDEGCEASGYLQDYGKRFIFLSQVGAWYPGARQPWRLSIPAGHHLQPFLKSLSLAGEGGVLVLGYPFQVFTKPDGKGPEGVFVKPIFTYQLAWQLLPDGLQLFSDDPWADVNLDWLAYALKKPDEQRAFLAACGLMDRGRIDESFGDGSRVSDTPDLRMLASGVTTFFGERIQEPLRPETISSLTLPMRPKSGIYNRAVLMIGNRTRYAKSLLEELAKIALCTDEDLDKTALRFIFKTPDSNEDQDDLCQDRQACNEIIHEGVVVDTYSLNGEQRGAVASLLTENVSVITGPPGTGKSQVVSAAMSNARLREETVIFSSRNHKALDSVVCRLVVEGQRPLSARANSKEDRYLKFGFEEALAQLLGDEHDDKAKDRLEAIRIRLVNFLENRGQLGAQANKVQDLRDQLGDYEQKISDLCEYWSPAATLELTKAPQLFPTGQLRKLGRVIGCLRLQDKAPSYLTKLVWWLKGLSVRAKVRSLQRILKQDFQNWQLMPTRKGFGGLREIAQKLPSLLQAGKFCDFQEKVKPIKAELEASPPLQELVPKIKELSERLAGLAPQALSLHLARCTGLPREADREELASLKSALRGLNHPVSDKADREAVQAALSKSLPLLLQHFPLWTVTNLAVGPRIPLLPGLFDLAILDEASQCDIPSAIPVIFRAKRVGVVGDPHQLSHCTKLSRTRDALLRKRNALVRLKEQRFSYPDTSLYDLFAQTNKISPVFLNETYRSVESIADYSNQNFYGGRLRVVTLAERLRIPKGTRPGIHWTDVASEIKSGGPSGCFAPEEIKVVTSLVREILIGNQFEGSLGVVTPFRQQANRLRDHIFQEIPFPARRSSDVIVDTAHGFQGDERDVMIMSLCGGPDMPRGSRGFLRETANLMNVAVSRARAVLHVVGNKAWAAESGISHLESLATQPQRPARQKDHPQSPWYPHESPWEKVLFQALEARGVVAEPQYPALGRRLDLALVRKGEDRLKIDIEVDGDRFHRNPDGSRKRDDVWRDIQLQGAGWRVIRFWVYQLREDLDKCVDKILSVWSGHE
jgi:very-short-patch-repair endonuclease